MQQDIKYNKQATSYISVHTQLTIAKLLNVCLTVYIHPSTFVVSYPNVTAKSIDLSGNYVTTNTVFNLRSP